jgi:hypothetical protein
MSDMQEIEIKRYQQELLDDVRTLVDKYRCAMEWDIPDDDEKESDRAIFKAIRGALDVVEHELIA